MFLSPKAGFKKSAAIPRGIPETEPVRFAVGGSSFSHLPNAFRYRACFVEDVIAAGVGRVLAGKRFAFFILCRQCSQEPAIRLIPHVDPVCSDLEPGSRLAQLQPSADRRPSLCFQLRKGIRCYRSLTIWPSRKQKRRSPRDNRRLSDAVTATRSKTKRADRSSAIEASKPYFLTPFTQESFLPGIRPCIRR